MSSIVYEFKAPYDRFVKAITIAVVLLLTLLSIYGLYLLFTVDWNGVALLALLSIALLPLLILVIPFLFSPRAYVLTATGVLIKRPLNSIFISYSSIASVRMVMEKPIWGIRLWGSGGLYGFIGLFHYKNLGRVWMYATDLSKMVLIETHQGAKYIISPSDPTSFIEKIKPYLEGSSRRSDLLL